MFGKKIFEMFLWIFSLARVPPDDTKEERSLVGITSWCLSTFLTLHGKFPKKRETFLSSQPPVETWCIKRQKQFQIVNQTY